MKKRKEIGRKRQFDEILHRLISPEKKRFRFSFLRNFIFPNCPNILFFSTSVFIFNMFRIRMQQSTGIRQHIEVHHGIQHIQYIYRVQYRRNQ